MNGYHFPFERLTEWAEILQAITIGLAVIGFVYVLVSLYYWTTQDFFATGHKRTVRPMWVERKETKTYLDLDHKEVRHSDAAKSDKDLT